MDIDRRIHLIKSNKIIIISLLFTCVLICSCRPSVKYQIRGVINIPQALDNIKLVNLSEVAESVKYIPLETTGKALIGNVSALYCDERYIYVVDENNAIRIFDIKGRFIKNINRVGRGPGEYIGDVRNIFLSGGNLIVTTDYEVMEYDSNGNFIKKTVLPKVDDYIQRSPIRINENRYLSVMFRPHGTAEYSAVIYDSFLNIQKMIPIPRISKANTQSSSSDMEYGGVVGFTAVEVARIFKYDNHVRISYPGTEEILSTDGSNIDTAYVIDYGKYRQPEGVFASANDYYINLVGFFETENYLLFNTTLGRVLNNSPTLARALYDKKTMETTILYDNVSKREGLRDDIYGGPQFWPRSASGRHTFISSRSAISMKSYVEKNSVSEELSTLISGLTENSNPVVIIVEMK